MNYFKLSFILFFVSNGLFAQFKLATALKSEAWLPEAYANADVQYDTTAYRKLIPVEGIENPFKLGYIKFYGWKPILIKTKGVLHKGIEKYQLIGINEKFEIQDTINLTAIATSKAALYIYAVENKLILEIVEKGKKQEIKFVNQFNGYQFKSIESAERYLKTGEK